MNQDKDNSQQYWASLEQEKMAPEIMERVRGYKKFLENTGMLQELRTSFQTYYGDTKIRQIDQSLQAIHVNHYANLMRHILADVTNTRPAWEARAINTDLESQADTQLATGLLDFYMREKRIEPVLNEAIEKCLFLREGWVSVGWNINGGEVYATNPDDGSPINEGDIEVKAHTLLDVTRDVRRKDMAHEWYVIREQKNKWNLAAQHPELAEKITQIVVDEKDAVQYELYGYEQLASVNVKTDLINVYTLMHEKTAAMPQGRMITVLNDEVVLFDGPLPYKRVYLFPCSPGRKFETAFGHSNMLDLLPTQQAFNSTVSAILTNQAANAVQNFQAPKGAAPKVTAVMDGLNVWEYDPKAGKLESMDLLKTAPEVFNFANFLLNQMEQVGGVPPISKGMAPATMSGTAMALLAQQAIQFSSGVQLSRTLTQEQVGTAIIELLQTFAVVPRVAQIVGKSKRSLMKTFKGSDLKGISRVICDTANPLTKTSAGRVEIANQLLQTPNMIKTPEQYISVLTTGNLEPLYEHEQSQLNLMRAENEKLMDAVPVQAMLIDDHPIHILEHACVLNSPEARENPQVVAAVLGHIQEHLELAKGMDPQMAMVLKQQSLFQPPQPPMAGPEGQGPAPVMDAQPEQAQIAENVSLPQPPPPPDLGGNNV
jgi:hypothetical protein